VLLAVVFTLLEACLRFEDVGFFDPSLLVVRVEAMFEGLAVWGLVDFTS
jgi:hypothetical protein